MERIQTAIISLLISPGIQEKVKSRLTKQPNHNDLLDIGSAFDIKMDDHSVVTLINKYIIDLTPFD